MRITRLLVANRGEVAVRIIRGCRDLGIQTIALYDPSDVTSLHVRRADEVVELSSPKDFTNIDTLLRVASERGAQAIHPGIGFLAEEPQLADACAKAGLVFVGPPASVLEAVGSNVDTLAKVAAAGLPTTEHSGVSFGESDREALLESARQLGFPLILKSNRGGRGAGQRLVRSQEHLEDIVHRAHAESQAFYGDSRLYLERAIAPAHQVGVQIVSDSFGHHVCLGEREGSMLVGLHKALEESPAPCLSEEKRLELWQLALTIAKLLEYQSVGTIEFLVDDEGQIYFTEIKPRLQTEHPLPEIVTRQDLVALQVRIAEGEPLHFSQWDVQLKGHAMMCRIKAEDPFNLSQASPGVLRRVRLPGGPEVRTDTYLSAGCAIPEAYDNLIAKLTVWAPDRQTCMRRFERALSEMRLIGTPTNLSLIEAALFSPEFQAGKYSTHTHIRPPTSEVEDDDYYRDLAVAAAIYHARRSSGLRPTQLERSQSGWHRSSRRLPGD